MAGFSATWAARAPTWSVSCSTVPDTRDLTSVCAKATSAWRSAAAAVARRAGNTLVNSVCAGFQGRTGGGQLRGSGVERVARPVIFHGSERGRPGGAEFFLTVQRILCLLQKGFGAGHGGLCRGHLRRPERDGGVDLCDLLGCRVHRRALGRIVDGEQKLPGGHAIAVVDMDGGDRPARLRHDRHRTEGNEPGV